MLNNRTLHCRTCILGHRISMGYVSHWNSIPYMVGHIRLTSAIAITYWKSVCSMLKYKPVS